jgi:hypothetical protein
MKSCPGFTTWLALAAALVPIGLSAQAPAGVSPGELANALRWRLIGPFRGGRVLAVAGVPSQPDTFYFGAVAGGVWKTTDSGGTWTPLFDGQRIASVGAVAVAPSDPNVLYVGTGEAALRSDITFGDGVYRSDDAGGTWRHVGLEDSLHIGRIVVDPKDPDLVLVAALGHAYGPNAERGVFRSTDGGARWTKVLYREADESTGAIELAADPDDPRTVYAALWNVRRTPWSAYAPVTGSGGGLFRSSDFGLTWTELWARGLPEPPFGRIGVAVAAGQQGRRVYALVDADKDAGLYRSDDGGESFRLVGRDPRIRSRAWYFGDLAVDPTNPDVVYAPNVALYRSDDGGATFEAWKGAPGGDDYHQLWIDPRRPERMIVASDQGAVVTLNGGRTWSSWYNQPTAQLYHVSTDDRFPFRVYGAQQDSGTVGVLSRGDGGAISFRDWAPQGGGESGHLFPDPGDPDIVYGGSTGGSLYRFDRRTGQVQDITPWPVRSVGRDLASARYRFPWTSALAVVPRTPRTLYYAAQVLFKSTNGGESWAIVSPDLTQRTGRSSGTEPAVGEERAVISAVTPSALERGLVWVGTDNGLVHLTRDDGLNWSDVTPEGLLPWSGVSAIESSPHDPRVAYAVIDRHQSDDRNPYILRTRDGGENWTKIADGIPAPAFVRAVRADPVRKGLLYAGTELGVFFSLDDGDRWQPLQLNLPVSPVHDLVVQGDALVVATHGRSFWILDGLAPLRQLEPGVWERPAHLFRPAAAVRVRASLNTDTPLPPETPLGTNPPAGAFIDYWLKSPPQGELVLEIRDAAGTLVRRFSSGEAEEPLEPPAFTSHWLRPAPPPPAHVGLNRFVWDLRYPRPPALRTSYGIATAPGLDTPRLPAGLLVLPGTYQVTMTVSGQSRTVPLEVTQDPRVRVDSAALKEQLDLWSRISKGLADSRAAVVRSRELRRRLGDVRERAGGLRDGAELVAAVDALVAGLSGLEGPGEEAARGLVRTNAAFAEVATVVESADAAPTAQAQAAVAELARDLDGLLAELVALEARDLPPLNDRLKKRGLTLRAE